SECDLALEADGKETAAAVASLGFRLLAEHLGVEADRVAEECARRGSLVSAIEELRSGERTLLPFSPEEANVWTVTTAGVADPERPIEPDLLIEDFLSKDSGLTRRVVFWRAALLFSGALALALLWQWGPLEDWITLERLSHWASSLRTAHWAVAIPVVLAVYVVSGVLMVPLTLLIVATAATFGAWVAALYAFIGTMASGMVTFGVGHLLGREALRRLAGAKLNRVSKKLARRGILAVATLRLLPLAPYGIVNMIAGASHIRFRDFIVGTFLGILPGIAAITLLASRIEDAIRNPGVETVLYVVFVLLILLAFGRWVRRRVLSENDRARG
ncbi:MAG: TVP38/TMEM64 family protein, partial [Vicinamibacteria bacterium]